MKRLRIVLCCLTVLLGWAVPTRGQTEIEAIEIRPVGFGAVDAGFVEAHTRVRQGDTFDRAALARDVRSLLETGRYTGVDLDVEPRATGVAVIFRLQPRLTLAEPVAFTGSDHLRESRLRTLLNLRPGDRVDELVLGERVRAIRDAFVSDYFPEVAVTWSIEVADSEQGLALVTVHIESGPRSRVAGVVFEGNNHLSHHSLRRVVGRPPWWNPLWLFRPRRYASAELESMRLAIRDAHRDEGFLDVTVAPVVIETDEHQRQTLRFVIDEGPRYRVGETQVTGVALYPESLLESLIEADPGNVAAWSAIRASARAMEDYYGSRGYARTLVRPLLRANPPESRVDVTYDVTEGELIRIGTIAIRGNRRTRDKVIRRELLIYPGDRLDEVRATRSERRLMNLGFFSDVRRRQVPTAVPQRENVIFEVEEKRTGQFMVGAGFSSVDDLIGFVELSQGNFDLLGWPYFTGGGQKLQLRAQFGSTRQDYRLSFVEPWFLDRRLSLGLDVYRTDLSYSDYDLRRTGGAVSLGHALPWSSRITYRYELNAIKITDIADTNTYVYADSPEETYRFDSEDNYTKSSLKVTLSRDTRDNPFVPTRGWRATAFGELAGGPLLGFDRDIYGLGATVALYQPLWFRHVLSVKSRFEMVDRYGDTDEVPISDRLFAGGGRTIRGFSYRDVGPKVIREDAETGARYHRPVGGQTLAVANAEYTVPIVDGIRIAMFYDIGGVWRDPFDVDFKTLASSTGVGLRFDLPGFPIRIDRAWVLEKDDDLTREDAWSIWIGYDF